MVNGNYFSTTINDLVFVSNPPSYNFFLCSGQVVEEVEKLPGATAEVGVCREVINSGDDLGKT